MRAVVQRVTSASVTVADEQVGAIGAGPCVLVAVTHGDTDAEARKLADKLWNLRVMDDDAGRACQRRTGHGAGGGAASRRRAGAGMMSDSASTAPARISIGQSP